MVQAFGAQEHDLGAAHQARGQAARPGQRRQFLARVRADGKRLQGTAPGHGLFSPRAGGCREPYLVCAIMSRYFRDATLARSGSANRRQGSGQVEAEHCEARTIVQPTFFPMLWFLAGRTSRLRLPLSDSDRRPNVAQVVQHQCYNPWSVPTCISAKKGELHGWTDSC